MARTHQEIEAIRQPSDEVLLTALDVAKRLRIVPRTVGLLPIPKIEISSKTIRYRLSDVEAYLASRTKK